MKTGVIAICAAIVIAAAWFLSAGSADDVGGQPGDAPTSDRETKAANPGEGDTPSELPRADTVPFVPDGEPAPHRTVEGARAPAPTNDVADGLDKHRVALMAGMSQAEVEAAVNSDRDRAIRVRDAYVEADIAIRRAQDALDDIAQVVGADLVKNGVFDVQPAKPMVNKDGSVVRGSVVQTNPKPHYPGQVVYTEVYRDKSTRKMVERIIRIDPGDHPRVANLQTQLSETTNEHRARVRAAVTGN